MFTIRVTEKNRRKQISFKTREYNPSLKEVIKEAPERRWNKTDTCWYLPITLPNLTFILETFDSSFTTSDGANLFHQKIKRLKSIHVLEDAPMGYVDIEIINEYQKALAEREALTKVTDYAKNHKFPTPPYKHQRIAFNRALSQRKLRKGFGLLFDMRTGKTKTSIDLFDYMYEADEVDFLMVVAPLGVLDVWENEFNEHSRFRGQFGIAYLTGSLNQRIQKLDEVRDSEEPHLIIINYEGARIIEPELIEFLKEYKVMLVADEMDQLCNHSTKQTQSLTKMGLWATYTLGLTGTLVRNDYLDVYSPLNYLDWRILGYKTYSAFERRYAYRFRVTTANKDFNKTLGFKHIDELKENMDMSTMRVRLEDCFDIKSKEFDPRYVEMGKEQQKYYNQMRDKAVVQMQATIIAANTDEKGKVSTHLVIKRSTATIVLTQILRMSEITSGYVKLDDGKIKEIPSAKMDELEKILRRVVLGEGHKVAIQCIFKQEIKRMGKLLKKLKIDYVEIHGVIKREERVKAKTDFQNKKSSVKVLLGQITSVRYGIDLSAASYVVRYSHSYSLRDTQQFEERYFDKKTKSHPIYIDLITKGSVDVNVQLSHVQKVTIADRVCKQGTDALRSILTGEKF